ncbi:MAG TPA: hypothetical protein VEA80_17015 [Vitreimonas sp.]|uniref:hypothetical protein n=1 Tax=Vitreimonas sp. TaxID=3069702 RepID=UPI002D741337|nr:hypothetical protein [Vitreimonas sp.]HYD89182.1 hypothetical protein [Vitreimonas sp.]
MSAAETLRGLLAEAQERLRLGEAAEAERYAKAVSAILRAERDVAEYAANQAQRPEEDEESQIAELLGRIRRLAAADSAGAPLEVLEQIAADRTQD